MRSFSLTNGKILFVFYAVLLSILFIVLFPRSTQAMTPYFNDRAQYEEPGTGNEVLRCGIPETVWANASYGNKTSFTNFIQNVMQGQAGGWDYSYCAGSDSYAGGSYDTATNNVIGAYYIVKSMIGEGFGTTSYGITQSEINDWYTKVMSSDIGVTTVYAASFSINTLISPYYDLGYANVFKYDDYGTGDQMVFYSISSGKTYYVIKRDCGNPLGDLPGLPESNYSLTPSISLGQSGSVESGADVSLKPSVINSGPATSSNTAWKITRTVNGSSATDINSGSSVFAATTNNWSSSDNSVNFSAGTKLCYVLSVSPHSSSDSGWVSSNQACITVSAKPKIQVWGSDLIVGGSINTSTSVKSGNTFGSWAEYGILTGGSINGMASGAAFAGASGLAGATVASYSKLSFNNTDNTKTTCKTSSNIGCYLSSTSQSLPDIAASFTTTSSTPALKSGSLTGVSSGIYTVGDDITIDASNIAKGQWIVINATGRTVTINGNISYAGETLHSISEIPQVIIIAKNINITDAVTHIDSWLIAKDGYINTCSSTNGTPLAADASLRANICNQKLTVNGPVIANKLYLRRTYYPEAGDSAETFNLSADAYLWSYAHASEGSRIQTVYTTELPPRL